MEAWITIVVAGVTVIGNIVISLVSNRKSMALIEYRLQQLEKKVDLHNTVIDRTYELEKQVAVIKEDLKNEAN